MRGLLALLATASLAVAGCSSSGTGPAPGSAVSSTSTPVKSSPTAGTSATETVTGQDIDAALVTPAEVGAGFTEAEFRPSNNPLPCLPNDLPVEEKYAANVRAGTALVSDRLGASISQEIRVYAGTATADQALGYIAQGLDCRTGELTLTDAPQTMHFSAEQNVTDAVHADAAFAVQATATRFSIILVACRVDRALVLFSFLKTPSTPDSGLPDPLQIVRTALAKVELS